MKKIVRYFVLLLVSFGMSLSFADETANIRIKINGTFHDNRYFLCLPNIGCLSLLAAKNGKVFPIFHPIEMDNIYVIDFENRLVSPEGLPDSCNISVNTNQTITISGQLITSTNQPAHIKNLHCAVS